MRLLQDNNDIVIPIIVQNCGRKRTGIVPDNMRVELYPNELTLVDETGKAHVITWQTVVIGR